MQTSAISSVVNSLCCLILELDNGTILFFILLASNTSCSYFVAGPIKKSGLLMHQRGVCAMMGFTGLRNAGARLGYK